MRQSTAKQISKNRVIDLADKLLKLVEQSYPTVTTNSSMLETVCYFTQEL